MQLICCFSCCLYELIETLWNVNSGKGMNGNVFDEELIETLWNVNEVGTNPFLPTITN